MHSEGSRSFNLRRRDDRYLAGMSRQRKRDSTFQHAVPVRRRQPSNRLRSWLSRERPVNRQKQGSALGVLAGAIAPWLLLLAASRSDVTDPDYFFYIFTCGSALFAVILVVLAGRVA